MRPGAYWDSLDGWLSGNSLSLGLVSGALAWKLLPLFEETSLTVFVALAPLWRDDPEKRALLEWALHVLLVDLPTPDTHHYGEGYILQDTDVGRIFENHVAMPHLGAHAQTYAAAMLLFGPAEPDDEEEDIEDTDGGDGGDAGCGCLP